MDFETDIVVELDTSQAKKDARDLTRSRVRSKKRQTEVSNRRSPVSGKLSRLAGGAAGFTAVSRMLHQDGGSADPWEAWDRPAAAMAKQLVDKQVGYSAIARHIARERTQQKLGFAIGEKGSLAPAGEFFERENQMQQEVEAGRNILRADPTFSGTNLAELLKRSVLGYVYLLHRSFGYMKETVGGK